MRCIFSISEEALEIRWRSLVRCKTNPCQQTRRHEEGHQQGCRSVESLHKPQRQGYRNYLVVKRRRPKSPHIIAISGHRSEQSLAHYNTGPSTSQLQQCSDVLYRSLNAEHSFFSGNQINDRTRFWIFYRKGAIQIINVIVIVIVNSRTQRDDNGNVKQLSWIALHQLHGTTSTCARHFGFRFQPGTLTLVFYFYLDLSCKSSTHFWHESAFKMHTCVCNNQENNLELCLPGTVPKPTVIQRRGCGLL